MYVRLPTYNDFLRLISMCVVFRNQDINIHEQLDLARHWGPLHKHATTPIPKNGLEEVHGQISHLN